MTTSSIDGTIDSIKNDPAVGVSDDYYQFKFGTVCWIIENEVGLAIILRLIDVSVSSNDHDPCKNEPTDIYIYI